MPSVERHRLVEELFHTAIDRGPKYLDVACVGDPVLRAELDALLASYHLWSAELPPAPQPVLPRFGPYVCDFVLGTGGMGTVYRAHRDDGQFQQNVAVKVLRGSLRGEWHRQRFLAERQILARLNHPHIAKLLDGGMTSDGEPFLVMELVDGEPIDAYCDRLQLSLEARVALFQQVLNAVAFAQHNLVVHRDLKPSNVLVTAEGEVKLLDFGTSRLTGEDVGTTLHRALTPRYASPEQLRGEPLTTTTDTFSLGVVLYELVSGKWPFGDPESGKDAWRRLSQEPEPNSIDWSNLTGAVGALPGDLTAILHKALETKPDNRYRSADEFSQDLRRSLTGQPVLARRQTFPYRASKYVRRNRLALLAAALLTVAVGAGLVSTLWQARRAERRFADTRSLANFVVFDINDGLQSLPGTTALQRKTVERSLSYLDALLRDAGDDQALRLEIARAYRRLGDVLGSPFQPSIGDRQAAGSAYAKGVAALAPLAKSPAVRLVEADLRLQHGGVRTFGATDSAGLDQMRQSIDELRQAVVASPNDVSQRVALAQGLTFLGGRSVGGGGVVETLSYADVPPLLKEAESQLTEAIRLDPNNLASLRALAQWESTAGVLFGSSQPALAIAHYRKSLDWLDQIPPADRDRLDVRRLRASVLGNIGWAEGQSGDRDQAVRHLTETTQILQAWADMDPADMTATYQLSGALRSRGIVLSYQKKIAPALHDFLAAAELHRRLSQRDSANVIYKFLRGELLARSGNLLTLAGRAPEARQPAEEGLQILSALADSPNATLSHIFGACRWLTETEVVVLRQPERAAGYCRLAAQRTDQKDPDAFEGLATALDQLGDAAGAAAAAQKAVALLPLAAPGKPRSQQRINMEAALQRYRAKARP